MKWDNFVECELMERTIGLPGLIDLCILGRKVHMQWFWGCIHKIFSELFTD